MTMEREELSTALRSLAGLDGDSAAPVAELIERGRRAERKRRAGIVTAASGVAAVTAITVGVGVLSSSSSPGGGSHVTASPQPALQLVSAAESTSRTSYRVAITYTVSQAKRKDYAEHYQGAFDPVAHRGYLRMKTAPARTMEFRYIGNDAYVQRGARWKRIDPAGTIGAPRGALPMGEILTAGPKPLLKTLATVGTVTRTGTGRYTFAYVGKKSAGGEPGGNKVTGTVVVADQKIKQITMQTTLVGPDPKIADRDPVTRAMVIDFSGYGSPVNVQRP
ncbi:hypothetical protein GCM10023196_092710 [Actinoallomurus vinaceus]|uniref:MucB/RseB N-terminal domain-containing protein n=1 Tax=Actinoallomurus vinaceus TaxID=1080074 RepID=A0ABP8UR01_9ACTN